MKFINNKIIAFVVLSVLAIGCKKGGGAPKEEEIKAPGISTLIAPLDGEPCNQGNILSETLSKVTFSWQAAENTDSYTVYIENLDDHSVQEAVSTATSTSVNLKRGISYEWYVVSKSKATSETGLSAEWSFYNAAEGVENHVPYPASATSPEIGGISSSNTVTFVWTVSDLDNDIVSYEVYVGTAADATVLQETTTEPILEAVSLSGGTQYYWKIHTKDAVGNVSISSVFNFTTPD